MPHSFGYRARTRYRFQKGFRQHGMPTVGKYLRTFRRGQYVDIMVDSAIQKGMPHKYYHGRTGIVYDVTPRAVGVEIAKRVRNREILKRFHVRIEHVRASRCQEEFLKRKAENDKLHKEAKARGEKVVCKRQPEQPKSGMVVRKEDIQEVVDLTAIPAVRRCYDVKI